MSIGRGRQVSKMKEYLLARYEEGEICLACSQSYPPNGILFCDECKGEGK